MKEREREKTSQTREDYASATLEQWDRGSTVVMVLCYRQFVESAVAQWLRCCATDSLWGPR